MSVTLAIYKSEQNVLMDRTIYASIEQEKFCAAYKLVIYAKLEKNPAVAVTLYSRTYTSKKTARAAMNRYAEDWLRIQ